MFPFPVPDAQNQLILSEIKSGHLFTYLLIALVTILGVILWRLGSAQNQAREDSKSFIKLITDLLKEAQAAAVLASSAQVKVADRMDALEREVVDQKHEIGRLRDELARARMGIGQLMIKVGITLDADQLPPVAVAPIGGGA